MRLKAVPVRQGLTWVRAGFRVFFRQPLGYSALFALVGLAVLVLAQLPLVGPVLALSLMPVVTVGFMLATREVLAGRRPQPRLLLLPLRDRQQRARLLQLGAIYAIGAIAVVLLAHLIDGGRLEAAIEAVADNGSVPDSVLQDPWLPLTVLLRLALMGLLSLVFWHAPALICWGGMPVGQALFSSIVACWRSLGAFVVYGLGWFVLLMLFVMAVQSLLTLLGLTQLAGQAALPAVLLFSTAFYASLYFSFVDSFELEPPDAAAPAA